MFPVKHQLESVDVVSCLALYFPFTDSVSTCCVPLCFYVFILSLLGKEKIFRKFHQITCAALMSAEEIGVKSRKSQKMNGSLS